MVPQRIDYASVDVLRKQVLEMDKGGTVLELIERVARNVLYALTVHEQRIAATWNGLECA